MTVYKYLMLTGSTALPARAFLVCVIELSERFCYYGVSGVFNNYLAEPYGSGAPYEGIPGAIGRGSAFASSLQNFWQFWCYVTPIIGAIVADQYLGRYKTIVYFSVVYICGLIILLITSLPFAIQNNAALGGLAATMVVMGLGEQIQIPSISNKADYRYQAPEASNPTSALSSPNK